jgi:hypothetical protein
MRSIADRAATSPTQRRHHDKVRGAVMRLTVNGVDFDIDDCL